jgi:hypothetical protein
MSAVPLLRSPNPSSQYCVSAGVATEGSPWGAAPPWGRPREWPPQTAHRSPPDTAPYRVIWRHCVLRGGGGGLSEIRIDNVMVYVCAQFIDACFRRIFCLGVNIINRGRGGGWIPGGCSKGRVHNIDMISRNMGGGTKWQIVLEDAMKSRIGTCSGCNPVDWIDIIWSDNWLMVEGERGWARSRIIRPQENLILYKSFNTLWIYLKKVVFAENTVCTLYSLSL